MLRIDDWLTGISTRIPLQSVKLRQDSKKKGLKYFPIRSFFKKADVNGSFEEIRKNSN